MNSSYKDFIWEANFFFWRLILKEKDGYHFRTSETAICIYNMHNALYIKKRFENDSVFC